MRNVLTNKKFIASAVTVAAVATAVSPASADMKFTDVGDRYTDAVQFLVDNGITEGFTGTTFGTQSNIKRQDAAVLIAKGLGFTPEDEYADSGFTDVPKHAKWAVDALTEAGIFHGKTATSFGATDSLTRNETAKVMATGLGLEIDETVKETVFTDVNERFAKYVDALVETGITVGKTDTQFAAEQAVSRGEMALFLYRAYDFLMEDNFSMSIMHMNDTHSHTAALPKVATAVKEFRAENPDSLLLHAGDVFSGTLYFNEFEGEADLALMNLMNFDAMVFGNHEFDLGDSEEGHKALRDFVAAANFPFLAANVDFSDDPLFTGLFETRISTDPDDGNIYSGMVKEVNGEKVGIFGLTTKDTEGISSPGPVTFSDDYIEEAQTMVNEFALMGVDKVIALTHIGYDDDPSVDNDLELAKNVEGIDVIVGGHSHTELEEPVLVEGDGAPTVIVQTGEYAKNLGTLDVTFDSDGVLVEYFGELVEIGEQVEDAEALKVLAPFKEKVDAVNKEEIGAVALEELPNPRSEEGEGESVRKNETALGNIVTDGMLAKAREINGDVVMALQNGGGIRTSIDKGPITVGEVIEVLPFGNTLALMDLTGTELYEAFELSVSKYPNELGGFLHVAGAKVEFDSSKEPGERVVSISIENEDGTFTPIEKDETYKIATNAFTAKGGDNYTMFGEAYEEGRVLDLGISDWENLRAELVRRGEVTAEIEGRIVDVNEAAVETEAVAQ